MAASLLLMASDKNKTMKPPPALCGGSSEEEPPKTEPSRSGRGRKATNNNGKGPNQKKTPQRGMGVAQLESILRNQEMNQIHRSSPSSSSSVITQLLSPTSFPVVVNDPFAGHYASPTNHGPLHHCPSPPLMYNGNVVIPGGSGQGPNVGTINANNNAVFNAIPGGFGAPAWTPLVGCPLETSRELSSMPNQHSESQPCDLCYKKKRFTTDDNNILRGTNTRRDSASDKWSMTNGPDRFLGFAPQQAPNLPAETTDFTTRMSNAHSYRSLDEPVGVVAVHRKVGSNMSGKIVMEYEFFPGKEDAMRGTTFKELGLSPVEGGHEAASSSSPSSSYSISAAESARALINADTTTTDAAAANSVDLSLRL